MMGTERKIFPYQDKTARKSRDVLMAKLRRSSSYKERKEKNLFEELVRDPSSITVMDEPSYIRSFWSKPHTFYDAERNVLNTPRVSRIVSSLSIEEVPRHRRVSLKETESSEGIVSVTIGKQGNIQLEAGRTDYGRSGLNPNWESIVTLERQRSYMKRLQQPREFDVEETSVAFATGSEYFGLWSPALDTMTGHGIYTTLHDVIYDGEIHDGMFHGKGTLYYPNGAKVEGIWENGRMVSRKYVFPDGQEYERKRNFGYCKMPDRRFSREVKHGLKPAGRCQLTNDHPPRPITEGCYDTGYGFYNAKTKCLLNSKTGQVMSVPTKRQEEWILKHCRKASDENVGLRPDLYECWFDQVEESSDSLDSEGSVESIVSFKKKKETAEDVFRAQVREAIKTMTLSEPQEQKSSMGEHGSETEIAWLPRKFPESDSETSVISDIDIEDLTPKSSADILSEISF